MCDVAALQAGRSELLTWSSRGTRCSKADHRRPDALGLADAVECIVIEDVVSTITSCDGLSSSPGVLIAPYAMALQRNPLRVVTEPVQVPCCLARADRDVAQDELASISSP